jgi:hypothetical protein
VSGGATKERLVIVCLRLSALVAIVVTQASLYGHNSLLTSLTVIVAVFLAFPLAMTLIDIGRYRLLSRPRHRPRCRDNSQLAHGRC